MLVARPLCVAFLYASLVKRKIVVKVVIAKHDGTFIPGLLKSNMCCSVQYIRRIPMWTHLPPKIFNDKLYSGNKIIEMVSSHS